MLSQILQANATSSDAALVASEEQMTWSQLAVRAEDYAREFASLRGQRVGFQFPPTPHAFAALFGLAGADCHVFLVAAEATSEFVKECTADFRWCGAVCPRDERMQWLPLGARDSPSVAAGSVTILTSGTTGKPKAVRHTWESLLRPVRPMSGARHPRWLLTFRPHLYAGLQVILQCFTDRGTLVLPTPADSASQVARLARDARVEYASATPSYWRWLTTFSPPELLHAVPLKQITLGGEVADQSTLSLLQQYFPNTRLVHIYATTELGRCFSVADGQAGFPAAFLDKPSSDGVEMRIESGELVVRSANAMQGYDGIDPMPPTTAWQHTGDLVEVRGGRVYFVGRQSDIINVGGNKVSPIEIEGLLREIKGVAEVRVFGMPSSLVGQIVACEIVLAAGYDKTDVERLVREKCVQHLATHQRPRLITFVDRLSLTAAGKTARR